MDLNFYEKEIDVTLCRYSTLMEQRYKGKFYAIVDDVIQGPYTIDDDNLCVYKKSRFSSINIYMNWV